MLNENEILHFFKNNLKCLINWHFNFVTFSMNDLDNYSRFRANCVELKAFVCSTAFEQLEYFLSVCVTRRREARKDAS